MPVTYILAYFFNILFIINTLLKLITYWYFHLN